ncbi:response regulator [Chitinophaga oryziterrae]|nr:response regulator [Chitinophaga oryziterrae]
MTEVFIIAPVILLLIVLLVNYYRVIYRWLLRNIVRPLSPGFPMFSRIIHKNDLYKKTALPSVNILLANTKMLVLSENQPDRIPIHLYLQEMGVPTIFSVSSQNILNTLDHFKPDVIIMEIPLPDLDGLGMIKDIRQHPVSTHLPLIAIANSIFPEAGRKAIAAGADVCLFHPIEPTQLLETLNLLLDCGAIPIFSDHNIF